MRQKGKHMNEGDFNKGNYCYTLQLSWEEVAGLLSDYVSRILERKVDGTAGYEDYATGPSLPKKSALQFLKLTVLSNMFRGMMRCGESPFHRMRIAHFPLDCVFPVPF